MALRVKITSQITSFQSILRKSTGCCPNCLKPTTNDSLPILSCLDWTLENSSSIPADNTQRFFSTTSTVSAQIELEQVNTTDIYLLGARSLFGTGTTHRGTYFKAIVRKPGFAYHCPTEIYMREMTRGAGVMMISLLAMHIMVKEMASNIEADPDQCRTPGQRQPQSRAHQDPQL